MNALDKASELETLHREFSVRAVTDKLKPSDEQDCRRCGDEIGTDRKAAVPEATLCIRCARAEEQRARR